MIESCTNEKNMIDKNHFTICFRLIMISFSDNVQKGTSKEENRRVEELFSDSSVLTSTPIANVNNNRGK